MNVDFSFCFIFNKELNFSRTESIFFREHKLSPIQLTWLLLVNGKMLYFPRHPLLMVYVLHDTTSACKECGNSICHYGNNISHSHVTFHLSQSQQYQLSQMWFPSATIIKSDYTIYHNGTNYQPSQPHGNNTCQKHQCFQTLWK